MPLRTPHSAFPELPSPHFRKRIMIVAGEASGDLHGANLVKEAKRLDPALDFFGIGGPRMREAGVETVVDSSRMAVVGLIEVISHFDVISRAYLTLKKIIRSTPPDLLILIDYPDFNLRIAKLAKKAGVPVLYYISPQVWAWRVGRVKKSAASWTGWRWSSHSKFPFTRKKAFPLPLSATPLGTGPAEHASLRGSGLFRTGPGKDAPLVSFQGAANKRSEGCCRLYWSRRSFCKRNFPTCSLSCRLHQARPRPISTPSSPHPPVAVKVVAGQGYRRYLGV